MGVVLLYHRVADVSIDPWGLAVTPTHFSEHLDVLRRASRPQTLQALAASDTPDPRGVAVTFDDGYADNALCARPLLEQFDVPATVFVATGAVGTPEFWWDELCRLTYDGAESDRGWRAWNEPQSNHQRQYHAAWEALRTATHDERQRALDVLRTEKPCRDDVLSRPMNHDELVSLARCELIEIGCHTRTHPVLSSLVIREQREEIAGSRRDLEEMIGKQALSFAYPYGHRSDYCRATVELVRESGFDLACANEMGAVRQGVDLLELPRIHVDDWNGDEFERRVSTLLDHSR